MIPGLAARTEAELQPIFHRDVTSLTPATFEAADFTLLNSFDAETKDLGITHISGPELMIAITDLRRPVGTVRVETAGVGTLLCIDNRGWSGMLNANIRVLGDDCVLLFNIDGGGYIALHNVFLRSSGQFLFWGRGATAVGCNIELEGDGKGVAIGDDALISNDVWIRNHDMHALHDVITGARIDHPPVTTVVERHVWLGQDALLLRCERIGKGAVVGARALVKGRVPPCVAVGGIPARVLREHVSWSRDLARMTVDERRAIGLEPEL